MADELLSEALSMLDRAGLQHGQLKELAEFAVKREF